MVLVAVGDHQPDDVLALRDEKADVRQDQVDAGQQLLGRKRHAAIDDQPLPAAFVAETVDREIHPDLTDAAQRREDQFVLRHQLCSLAATGKTSPAVIVCTVPSAKRNSNWPLSSSASARPTNSRFFGSRTRISPPMPAARSSQSARMDWKAAPRCHCASRRAIAPDSAKNKSSAETAAPTVARSVAG